MLSRVPFLSLFASMAGQKRSHEDVTGASGKLSSVEPAARARWVPKCMQGGRKLVRGLPNSRSNLFFSETKALGYPGADGGQAMASLITLFINRPQTCQTF